MGTDTRSYSKELRAASSGSERPMDLSVQAGATHFRAANSLVETTIPKHLEDGVKFPGLGYSVAPDGIATRGAPMRLDGVPFYANVQRDTDALVRPTPTGVETTLILRSSRSPEHTALTFDLAPGQELRPAVADPSGGPIGSSGAQIWQHGRQIAQIPAPAAVDAEGRQVPVTTRVNGHKLVFDVTYRRGGFRMPIAVDPIVDNYQIDANGNRSQTQNQDPFFYWRAGNATAFVNPYPAQPQPSHGFYVYKSGGAGSSGLDIVAPYSHQMNAGDWTEWIWAAPGQSFITNVTFGGLSHSWYYDCVGEGIWSNSRFAWESGTWTDPAGTSGSSPWGGNSGYPSTSNSTDSCAGQSNDTKFHTSSNPTPGNEAVFSEYDPFTYTNAPRARTPTPSSTAPTSPSTTTASPTCPLGFSAPTRRLGEAPRTEIPSDG